MLEEWKRGSLDYESYDIVECCECGRLWDRKNCVYKGRGEALNFGYCDPCFEKVRPDLEGASLIGWPPSSFGVRETRSQIHKRLAQEVKIADRSSERVTDQHVSEVSDGVLLPIL